MSGTSGSSGESRRGTPPSNIVTRNGARRAKIQTRAMSAGAKPSASVVAAKKKAQQKKKQNVDTVLRDSYQTAMDSKSKTKGPTGFVTEPRMAEHRCLWDHNYPECPERLISVIERCCELDLISQCVEFAPRAATRQEVEALHSPQVYELLETTRGNTDARYLEEVSSLYDAVFLHPEMALVAAGSTIDMVRRVCAGEVQAGAVFVRPPGHHAMRNEPCGYCFYNNVALAARHALDHCDVQRILIVDWDVHHGQATQQMFYDDPRVVYFSVHRYEHGAFWPGLRHGDFQYTGAGRGLGHTFNVPLNRTGLGDADYLAVWHQLLLPMAFEFRPELVVISAGFDSALGDEKGEMRVTPACYAHLVSALQAVCAAVCVVLEGGYCLPSLAEGAALTLRTLIGHPPPALPTLPSHPTASAAEPSDSIRESILNCIYAHKPYWKCYQYQPTYSVGPVPNVCDVGKEKHAVRVVWCGDETRADRFPTRDCYPVHDPLTRQRHLDTLATLKRETDLTVAKHQVCYVYDEAMLKHRNICEPDHVESPERVSRAHERLREFGLLERMWRLRAAPAADTDILAAHSPQHLRRLKELSNTKLRDLHHQQELHDSVYFHPESYESAAMAAGCVIQAVDAVLSGEAGAGVCCVRPPGHHAGGAEPAGFCLLNNVVIGARRALRHHRLQRVMILDWDVHHGNGTQDLTYHQPEILFVSLHRYDGGAFFPHSAAADHAAVGAGPGEGFNINVPWNKRGMGDAEYLAAMTQIVLPVAYEYRPQLVLVSAGFDAAPADPLGGCRVSPECFGRMTHMLRGLAGGRVVLALEGGYNVSGVSYCLAMCAKALLGDPLPPPADPLPPAHPSAVQTINDVIATHKKYWKSLKFQLALPAEDVLEPTLPSRGLTAPTAPTTVGTHRLDVTVTVSALEPQDSVSSLSTLDDSLRSAGELDDSLERRMGSLSIQRECGECGDGVHCGTDTDDDAPSPTTPSERHARARADQTDQRSDTAPAPAPTLPGPSTATTHTTHTTEPKQNKEILVAAPQPARAGSSTGGAQAEPQCSKAGREPAAPAAPAAPGSEEKRTLVDFLAENMQSIVEGQMFAVVPLPWCPHLRALPPHIPAGVTFQQGAKCVDCDITHENWVCLHCYITACSRYGNAHMSAHAARSGHALTLSLADLSVWCYACDAYVDHALLYPARNIAHTAKFGEELPWCYPHPHSDPDHPHTIHMQ